MNFHTDEWIYDKMGDHYEEALKYFDQEQVVGLFLQGSQNYGVDTPNSDVDTKLIVAPTFKDIAMNHKPISTTHVRANNEHIDFKDLRLYMQTFRKQNINFLEILFTEYYFITFKYFDIWMELVDHREQVARYNPHRAVAAMKGVAEEKYHAMEHRYPSKIEVIDRYGYDPKQTHHLLRVEDFLERYIAGEKYANCIVPANGDFLVEVKQGLFTLDEARKEADRAIAHIRQMSDDFRKVVPDKPDPEVEDLLNDVQYRLMRAAVMEELYD